MKLIGYSDLKGLEKTIQDNIIFNINRNDIDWKLCWEDLMEEIVFDSVENMKLTDCTKEDD